MLLTTLVKSNTSIDRDARKRATSVYLVQRAVPMLPPQLSEQLCSLQPGVDRLTFSAIFTVDKDGMVLKKSFARTVIRWVKPEERADPRSCGKLSYADAQGVIRGDTLAQAKIEGLASEVEKDIRALHVGCEICSADVSPSPPRSVPVVSSLAP
jgi:protein SSD1